MISNLGVRVYILESDIWKRLLIWYSQNRKYGVFLEWCMLICISPNLYFYNISIRKDKKIFLRIRECQELMTRLGIQYS